MNDIRNHIESVDYDWLITNETDEFKKKELIALKYQAMKYRDNGIKVNPKEIERYWVKEVKRFMNGK